MPGTLDHLLLGCADLRSGVEWFSARSGVEATPGGEHPAWGTHNALVALGARQYLELIAPHPALGPYRFPVDVRGCAPPRLVTWAVAVTDLDAVVRAARLGGLEMTDPRAGSRTRPDGRRLAWRTAALLQEPARPDLDVLPFPIEWGAETPHPAQDSAAGCYLRRFAIAHPDPDGVARRLDAMGVSVRVECGPAPALVATLETPRGLVTVSSAVAD